MLHLVTKHTAVTGQTPSAKSHPFGSDTLHFRPVEHLRNLLPTHPAAVGIEWSSYVWDLCLPVFLVNRQALFLAGSLPLLKGMCMPSVWLLSVSHIECDDCSFCLRSVCIDWRHTDSLSPLLCHRFYRSNV